MKDYKPVTFPMFAEPFGDENLSMAARGLLATIRANQMFDSDITEEFYEKHRGPVQELIKKGYLLVYREFSDTDNVPDEYNPIIHDISASPIEIREELNSKEYYKILSEAMGLTWDTKAFNVHHINHDRKDNRVENLLLLPKKLHSKYHYYEFQTKKLREELSFEGIVSDIVADKNKIFSFIYTIADMAEMKKIQENIIRVKKYCDDNSKEFNARDMFVASNNVILQKYA